MRQCIISGRVVGLEEQLAQAKRRVGQLEKALTQSELTLHNATLQTIGGDIEHVQGLIRIALRAQLQEAGQ